MTRSRTCQSFEAYLTFKIWRLSTSQGRCPPLLCVMGPASLKFTTVAFIHNARDNPKLVLWPAWKSPFSLFHVVVNTATLFVTLVKFPKAWLHMSTIIPRHTWPPKYEGFQPHKADVHHCCVWWGQPASNSQQWLSSIVPETIPN
jgi:hypothetical protein